DERVHVRRDALGAHHVIGGEATDAVHRLDAVTLARRELRVPDLPVERLPELVDADDGTARRLRRGWRGRRSRPRGGGGRLPCIAGGRGRTLLQERHDVVLRYATTAAGALRSAVTLARRELRVPDLPVERLPELVDADDGTARRLRRGWRGRRSRPRGGGGRLPCIAGGRGRTLLQERHDVVLRYATTAAGAL